MNSFYLFSRKKRMKWPNLFCEKCNNRAIVPGTNSAQYFRLRPARPAWRAKSPFHPSPSAPKLASINTVMRRDACWELGGRRKAEFQPITKGEYEPGE